MYSRKRDLEVSFYIDRNRECAIRFIQAIMSDPRLKDHQKLNYVLELSAFHKSVAEYLEKRVRDGFKKAEEPANSAL
ncbi:MAG: hypothetical protein D6719_01075 [Candidatus Dadabacteria bacterium]|nr:MAG: hypothetical protein D6719_01075 [Candidatus Dadabacteria bacterium]